MNAEIAVIPRGLAALSDEAPALFLPTEKAAARFFDFFTSNIRNKNTRRAYYNAVCRFANWCEGNRGRTLSRHAVNEESADNEKCEARFRRQHREPEGQ